MYRMLFLSLSLLLLTAASPEVNGKDYFENHPGLWSFLYLISACLSLIVSVIGIVFIWHQIKSGKEALYAASRSAESAADAARIAHASVRPWIKFTVKKAYLHFNDQNTSEVGCQIDYKIENIGNTPAVELKVVFKPIPVGHGIDVDFNLEFESLKSVDISSNPRVVFPRDIIEEGLSTNFPFAPQLDERMLGFKVIAAVVYKAAFDGQEYWTPVAVGLQHETPPEDRVYRFYRGMGHVPCLVIYLGKQTPPPT
jgi:hypothetical protein